MEKIKKFEKFSLVPPFHGLNNETNIKSAAFVYTNAWVMLPYHCETSLPRIFQSLEGLARNDGLTLLE